MSRMLIGFLIGVVLTGVLSFTVMSLTPVIGDSDEESLTDILAELSAIYTGAISQPVQSVGEEIQDEEIAQFYQDLVHHSYTVELQNTEFQHLLQK